LRFAIELDMTLLAIVFQLEVSFDYFAWCKNRLDALCADQHGHSQHRKRHRYKDDDALAA
jgi:hypothetical protein